MSKKGMMPFAVEPATMWTLGKDRKSIRFAVPPLWLAGMPEPIHAFVEFDAKTVDAIVERLTILRSQMLPPLPARSLVRWHQGKAREGIDDVFGPAKVAVPVTTRGAGEAASRREGSTILGIAPVPVAKILARCRPPRTRETAVPASSFLRQRLISQGTQAIRRTPPRLPL